MSQSKVLLVDDEEELVSTLTDRLRWRNLDADAATSGYAALELLQQQNYDIVVIDLMMPGLDGLDLRRIIRRDYPGVEVLLITGHGADLEGQEFDEDIVGDVLLKPFDINELVARIREKLGNDGRAGV
ncbi:MAG: response regulator [bacterium]